MFKVQTLCLGTFPNHTSQGQFYYKNMNNENYKNKEWLYDEYINKRKGVRVNIDLFSNTEHIPSFARKHLLIHQFQLLDTAYQSAISYFFNEKY